MQISHITILKYIKESILLELVTTLKTDQDKRKVILLPTKKLIQDFEVFFYEHINEIKKLY